MQASLFLILMLMTAVAAHGEIYTWEDESGQKHFSDTPVHGSELYSGGTMNTMHNPANNLGSLRKEVRYRQLETSMMVSGRVNRIPVDFVVDTGAGLVVIPPAVARRAHIPLDGAVAVELQTANGRVKVPMVVVEKLEIGSLTARGISAAVQDIKGDGRTGLLGMNFLRSYKMTVDHNRSMLYLEPR